MSIFQKKQEVAVDQRPRYVLLTGIDKEKLLEGYENNLHAAEVRRQAIFDEIMRLQVEYQNTSVAIEAIKASVNILREGAQDPLDKLEGEIQHLLETTDMESGE